MNKPKIKKFPELTMIVTMAPANVATEDGKDLIWQYHDTARAASRSILQNRDKLKYDLTSIRSKEWARLNEAVTKAATMSRFRVISQVKEMTMPGLTRIPDPEL